MKRKVNLNEITVKEPLKVKTTIQPSQMELPKEEVSKASPVELEVEIRKKPTGYGIKGKVSGEVELTCSKCNKKFIHKFKEEFDYDMVPTRELGSGEIKKGDLDIKFSDETVLDLAELAQEQIILNLPVKPVCSKECEESSISYSEGPEEPEKKEEQDPRWAKLKELHNKLKKE